MNIIIAILIFSLVIIIHELGHFLLAKKNGITVTEFSVGMGTRIVSFVKGGTRYSIKLFPFGGSCMMLGEDESVEDEGAFHKKGVWARISVIIAGPIFNFILAFILALVVIGIVGVDPSRINGVTEGSPMAEAGLKEGDMITNINGSTIRLGREIESFFMFEPLSEKQLNITYERDGEKHEVTVKPKLVESYLMGCHYSTDNAEIVSLTETFPLYEAGVQLGDVIVGVNGTEVSNGTELSKYFDEHPLSNQPVTLTYRRDGKDNTITISPKLYSEYTLGWDYNVYREKVSPLKVIGYSAYEVKYWIVNTIKSIGHMIRGKVGLNEISGPVGVVNIMNEIYEGTKEYGIGVVLLELINFTILLSANLGVMNLLPLPALDGGRLVFHLIEVVRGKPVAREKEALVHMIGMVALMVLMVFVLFNDIRNIFN
ncbi:MAG: hypothetical protein K0S47_4016 [Herbinix sp.]|jgi:regulator of sigma E protease|nr:hypothetical protein [Herbinix sp.]